MKLFSSEVALDLYKSATQPFMEFCCRVWAGVPSCYPDMFYKLQKWVCSTFGRTFATSLESLTQC